jgi:integrin alpha FG-GAP repeat containing protein 1
MFHDAFFLKALVLNGACGDQCEPVEGGKRYSVGSPCATQSTERARALTLTPLQPYGAVLPGATFKFSTLTASGQRVPSQGELNPIVFRFGLTCL